MLKAIKIRLYPNIIQKQRISQHLGCQRVVYNKCLEYKKQQYEQNKKYVGLKDINLFLTNLKKQTEFIYLNEVSSHILQCAFIDMLDAYKHFFRNGYGFPKFKSKKDNILSCRFPIKSFSRYVFKNNKLHLTKKLKNIKFNCNDKYLTYLIKHQKQIKSITLSKTKTYKYFASILIDSDLEINIKKPINKSIGIDLGIKTFASLSTSEVIDNPKLFQKVEKQIVRLQKQHSKKQKGSKNKEKIRLKLAKKYEKLTNQKLNFLHKLSKRIVDENQIIILEDLKVANMLKNHKLAKSIQPLSWGEFIRQLEYKSKWYGREVIRINQYFASSKTCSNCGNKKDLNLSERIYICPKCGLEINRDYNASLNIEKEGLRLINENKIGWNNPEFKLVENSSMDDRNLEMNSLKSICSVKQEIFNNE